MSGEAQSAASASGGYCAGVSPRLLVDAEPIGCDLALEVALCRAAVPNISVF
jgi:hypothetical protein